MKPLIPIFFAFIVFIIGCTTQVENIEDIQETRQEVSNMKLTSPAFEHNQEMPSEYTCDGSDTSPELNIENVPEGTKSLALIMDDPDAPAGTWVHWVVWNIPPETKSIAKANEPEGVQGTTSFGRAGYGGPCPPSGTHRYFFKLYALDSTLNLAEDSKKEDLLQAMEGHIIEQAELIGLYKKQ